MVTTTATEAATTTSTTTMSSETTTTATVLESSTTQTTTSPIESNESHIIIKDSENNLYDLGEFKTVSRIDFDAIKKAIETLPDSFISDSSTSKRKDVKNIADNDEITLYGFSAQQQVNLREVIKKSGVYLFNTSYKYHAQKGACAWIYYSSNNDNPFMMQNASPVIKGYESYNVSGHSNNCILNYDYEVFKPNDKDSLIYNIEKEIENTEREINLYDNGTFDGKVYERQAFDGVYKSKNNTQFLICHTDQIYKPTNGTEKTYTVEYHAFAIENGTLHNIGVYNSMDLYEVNTLPDKIDMIDKSNFQKILDGFNK